MDFKIGFLIKPFEILENNEITFISSSGVKPATYTESDCLAYGFIYNDSKCWSVQNSTSFLPPDNQNILQAGANNIIGVQSSDCSIIGINNELRFNDKNSLIVGDRNVINDDVNNTIVSGTKGDATATNSIVLGGNTILAGTSPLGDELVLNGDFSEEGIDLTTPLDFTTWLNTGGTTSDITAKSFRTSSSGAGVYFSLTTNKVYKINVSGVTGDISLRYRAVQSGAGTVLGAFDTDLYFNTSGLSSPNIYIRSNSATTATVTNVSVKEVGQDWSLGGGWSIGDDAATASAATGELSQSGLDFDTSKSYYIGYTISGYSGSGGVTVRLKGSVWNTGTLREGDGTFTEVLTSTAENTIFTFVTSSSFTGSISNVSVKEQFPYVAPRQSIKLMYGGTTTNDTSTPLYLNTIVDKYLNIPINTAMSFNADILALRVGGTAAGDNGDFASWIERGVIINENGVISVSTTNTPVVSSGTTTGWIPSSAIPTSTELVTNGDFATDAYWSKQAGWTISGGTANFLWSGDGNRNIYQSMLTVGTTYELKYDVLNFVAGSIRNVSTSSYVTRSANGSYSETFVATYSTLYLKCATRSNLSIDNVSVKEVIASTGTDYNINVVGAVNTTIEWASTINFTQIKTNTTL